MREEKTERKGNERMEGKEKSEKGNSRETIVREMKRDVVGEELQE